MWILAWLACHPEPAADRRSPRTTAPTPSPPAQSSPSSDTGSAPDPLTSDTGEGTAGIHVRAIWTGGTNVRVRGLADLTGDGEPDLLLYGGIVLGPLLRDLDLATDSLALPRDAGLLGDLDGDGAADLWAGGRRAPHILYGPITDSWTVDEVDAAPGPVLPDPDDVYDACVAADLDGRGIPSLACGGNDTWGTGIDNPVMAWDLPARRDAPIVTRFEVRSCLPDGWPPHDYGWYPYVTGVEDADADGVRDVVATGSDSPGACLGAYVASAGLEGVVDPEAPPPGFHQVHGYVVPLHDLDGDGVVDWLVQRAAHPVGVEQVLFAGPLAFVGSDVEGRRLGTDVWMHFTYGPCGYVFLDLDGDGRLEWTEEARSTDGTSSCGASAGDPGTIDLYPNTASGWTDHPPPVALSFEVPEPGAFRVSSGVDLDQDGRDEILVHQWDDGPGRILVMGFGRRHR